MKNVFACLTLTSALFLSGCAFVSVPQSTTSPAAPVQAVELDAVPEGMVRVVLVRADNDKAGVLNVFQGGRFHASLRAGDFTVLNMCANDAAYSVTSLESPTQLSDANVARLLEMRERLNVGQQRYYKVALQDVGAVSVQPLVQAGINWAGLSEQRRVVSRVNLDCAPKQPAPVVAVAPVVVQPVPVVVPVAPLPVVTQPATLSIPSDLVFPFASYSLNEAVGGVQIRQRLEQFLKDSGIKEVESVVVKGHSDPIGQPHRKELVSGERAKAVAAYVVRELNLPPSKVKAQAMSDRELLVSNCPVKPVAQRDACNAPNRRVELVVTGRR
jgi:OOP family OmpA-OmpF porin